VIVLIAVPHGPIMVTLPIAPFSISAGLLSTPLIPTPVVSAPIVSTIVPTAVTPVSVVMGKQRPWLLAGHTGQGRPRVVGGLGRSLNGGDFSCKNRGWGLHLCCGCRAHCREREQGEEHHPWVMEFHERRQPLIDKWTCGHLAAGSLRVRAYRTNVPIHIDRLIGKSSRGPLLK